MADAESAGGNILYTTQQYISQHVDNIYKDGELSIEATNKKFLLVHQEGNRQVKRNIDHYNLDMIIVLDYRVQSQVATRFHQWATQRLHEYIQKGFAMYDERLKQGGNRYFRELLQRIWDIRSSERNVYQQVADIYATATDYDPRSEMTKIFFATVIHNLHYTIHEKPQPKSYTIVRTMKEIFYFQYPKIIRKFGCLNQFTVKNGKEDCFDNRRIIGHRQRMRTQICRKRI